MNNKQTSNLMRTTSLSLLSIVNISSIIFVSLATIGGLSYILVLLRVIPIDFYTHPLSGLLGIIIVSTLVVYSTNSMIKHLFISPIDQMVEAVNALAKGIFETRVELGKGYHPAEILDFTKSYNKAAEQLGSVEMLGKDFINNFSHEFKTPIVSIKGFAELLMEHNFSKEEQKEYLQIIVDESNRLTKLSTNVLNLSKVESQSILINQNTFALGEQIRQIYLIVQSKWEHKNITFDIDIDDFEYYGDEDLLKQVWINILDNAIKFSKNDSKITISAKTKDDKYIIIIQDQGIGMNSQTLERIFDKFYQGDSSHAVGGNGLGMSLVKKIITLHNGKLIVDSEENSGTTMSIVLTKK